MALCDKPCETRGLTLNLLDAFWGCARFLFCSDLVWMIGKSRSLLNN